MKTYITDFREDPSALIEASLGSGCNAVETES
jgi:hypothetical protein